MGSFSRVARIGIAAVFSVELLISIGCGNDGYQLPSEPVKVAIDPHDRDRVQKIMQLPLDERFKEQIAFLQDAGHDIDWYPKEVLNVKDNPTVQVIIFEDTGQYLGFCSGAFVSRDFVVSAAHCNTANPDLHANGSCRGNIVFAYKSSENGLLEYYECQEISISDQAQNVGDNLVDVSLYKLSAPGPESTLKAEFSSELSQLSGSSSSGDYLHEMQSVVAVTLAVNPPENGANLKSAYTTILGKFVSGPGDFPGMYVSPLVGSPREGNSGAPIFSVPQSFLSKSPLDLSATDGERMYLAPLIGTYGSDSTANIVATDPHIIAQRIQSSIKN